MCHWGTVSEICSYAWRGRACAAGDYTWRPWSSASGQGQALGPWEGPVPLARSLGPVVAVDAFHIDYCMAVVDSGPKVG